MKEFDHIVNWKPILGWPYDVSSSGLIRNQKTNKILTATRQKSKMKYLVVTLYNGSRDTKTQFYVHLLVCKAFNGNCPDGHQCRHIDGNVLNCGKDNLKWGTPVENQHDRVTHGTHSRGSNNGRSLLSEHDVMKIRERVRKVRSMGRSRSYGLIKKLAMDYGVKRDAILRAVSGQSWRNI